MIDIHSHVLYGLDDGAEALEDSVAMARMAHEFGTTDLVATPHADPTYSFEPERIRERLAELASSVDGALRLYSGCDFHLSYDNIRDAIANPRKYTINQKCYLLVEFSDLLIFHNTPEIFSRLRDAGMLPVVTHPERNGLLQQRLEDLARWIEAGAFIQVTAQSLVGDFGRRAQEFCRTLLDRRMVHFVASDAHDCQRRPPRLDHAYAWLKERYGEALADALCVTNPRATLTGEALDIPAIEVSSETRKWYQFWR